MTIEVRHFKTDPKPIDFDIIFVTEDNVEQVSRFLGCKSYSLNVNLSDGSKTVEFKFKELPRYRDDFSVVLGEAISKKVEDPDDDWDPAPKAWVDTLIPTSWSGVEVPNEELKS